MDHFPVRSSGHIQAKGSMLKRSYLYFTALVYVILSNKAFCHAIVSTLGERPGKVAAEKLNPTMQSSKIPQPRRSLQASQASFISGFPDPSRSTCATFGYEGEHFSGENTAESRQGSLGMITQQVLRKAGAETRAKKKEDLQLSRFPAK